MNIFSWKGAVFSSSCTDTKLKVNWCYPNVTPNWHPWRGASDKDHEVSKSERERDSYSDIDDIFQDDQQFATKGNSLETILRENASRDIQTCSEPNKYWNSSTYGLTEIDVHLYGYESGKLSILANGFSFDPFSAIRVPVFVVSGEGKDINSPDVSWESKSQIQITSKRAILYGLSEVSLIQDQTVKKENMQYICGFPSVRSFKLVPLRIFNLEFESNSFDSLNIRFISNYGFVHVTSDKLSLYFGTVQRTERINVQHFDLKQEDMSNRCKILLFDVFNCFERNFFVFMGFLSDVCAEEFHSKSCVAVCFYSHCQITEHYKSKNIQVKKFFPEEYSQIVLSFLILNLTFSRTSFQVRTSSMIMISITGFAMRFTDGEMTHCVCLNSCIENPAVLSQNGKIKIIDSDSISSQKAAIYIDEFCEIVDWSKKKVSSSYSNVSFISKYNSTHSCDPSLLLLLYPQCDTAKQDNFCVKDLIPLIIDATEVESIAEGRESPAKGQIRNEPCEHAQSYSDVPQYVLESLTCQEKKCQSELKERDQIVRNKAVFITNMQQILSNESSQGQGSDMRNMYLQPLVLLTQESVPKIKQRDLITPSKHIPKFGQLWKRAICSLFICGVEIKNISMTCQLSQLNLTIVPINPSTSSFRCSSKVSDKFFSPPSPLSKKICLQEDEETECSERTLKQGESASITAYTDSVKLMGGEAIMVKVLLTYTLHNPLKYQAEGELAQSICCGSFLLSPNDIVSETFSLKPHITGNNEDQLNNEDMLALDCIQKSCILEISSVMSSVLTLKSGLKFSPLVTFIAKTDQFIISADHPLQYCRIKWLSQTSKQEGRVKLYTRSQTDILLLVQFLYNLAPKDITLRLSDNHSKPSLSAIKSICQSLVDRVDNSIIEIEKSISTIEVNEKETIEKPNGVATSVPEDNSITAICIDHLVDKGDNDEVTESLPTSPTFHSSASRRGKMHQKNIFPSTSTSNDFVAPHMHTDSGNFESDTAKSKVINTLPDSDTALVRKKHNDPSKFKNKSKKGSHSKGKGKLTTKK